jgi:hypothetical protein
MCDPVTLTVVGTSLAEGAIGAAASAAAFGTAAVGAAGAAGSVAAGAGLLGTAGAFSGMTALTVASAGAGLLGQQQMADAQKQSNNNQYHNAIIARSQNANQVNLERMQAGDQAGQKINENNMAMRQAQSVVVARAGPSGLSVEQLLANLGTRGANYNDSVNQNLDRTNMSLNNQLENINTRTSSDINNLKTPAMPDYLGTALKIGQAYQPPKVG